MGRLNVRLILLKLFLSSSLLLFSSACSTLDSDGIKVGDGRLDLTDFTHVLERVDVGFLIKHGGIDDKRHITRQGARVNQIFVLSFPANSCEISAFSRKHLNDGNSVPYEFELQSADNSLDNGPVYFISRNGTFLVQIYHVPSKIATIDITSLAKDLYAILED